MAEGLQGRVALITGSSRGIGAAIARLFAAERAAVDEAGVQLLTQDVALQAGPFGVRANPP